MKTKEFISAKFTISLLMLFNLLTACRSGFESKVEKKILSDSKTHYKVMLSLKELTDFDWDRLYVFEAKTSREDINRALGFDYPYYKESCRTYVFINDEKIVYHEEVTKKKEIANGQILFNHKDSLKFYSCKYGDSFFMVNEKKSGGKIYYELNQL